MFQPIEWYDRHNKKVAVRSNKNTRVYVEKMTGDKEEPLVPLIIHHADVTDSGNWTCKAGDFSDYIDILVGGELNKRIVFTRSVLTDTFLFSDGVI